MPFYAMMQKLQGYLIPRASTRISIAIQISSQADREEFNLF